MVEADPAALVRQENQRLAALGTGLRLEIRQQRLGLRGPLP